MNTTRHLALHLGNARHLAAIGGNTDHVCAAMEVAAKTPTRRKDWVDLKPVSQSTHRETSWHKYASPTPKRELRLRAKARAIIMSGDIPAWERFAKRHPAVVEFLANEGIGDY